MMNLPVDALRKYCIENDTLLKDNCFHFLYVLDGAVTVSTDTLKYMLHTEDILLVSPNHKVNMAANGPNTVILLSLEDQFIYSQFGHNVSFVCNSALEPQKDYWPVKKLLLQILSLYTESANEYRFKIMGDLYLLLNEISKEYFHKTAGAISARKNEIIDFIDDNYRNPITLQTLADALYLSPQYVSSFFKKAFSVSFKQYLIQKRLFHAERAIKYTSTPLIEIAADCGFQSFNTFYKNKQ